MSKKDPNKKGLIKEFKEFISRGSVLDLAVGMIIGAAFTAIITAVVNYVLKPLISLIPLGQSGTFKTVLKPAVAEVVNAEGEILVAAQDEIAILWSEVISAIITFLATALVLFIIVKAINTAKAKAEKAKAELEAKKQAEEPAPEPEPAPVEPVVPEDIKLLSEIRDLLKAKE